MPDTTLVAVLAEARRLVLAGWCRENYAVTMFGERCDPRDADAARYCALGAIRRACQNLGADLGLTAVPATRAVLAAALARDVSTVTDGSAGEGLAVWNDSRDSAAEVAAAFADALVTA